MEILGSLRRLNDASQKLASETCRKQVRRMRKTVGAISAKPVSGPGHSQAERATSRPCVFRGVYDR